CAKSRDENQPPYQICNQPCTIIDPYELNCQLFQSCHCPFASHTILSVRWTVPARAPTVISVPGAACGTSTKVSGWQSAPYSKVSSGSWAIIAAIACMIAWER